MRSTKNVESKSFERLYSPVPVCDGAKLSGGMTKTTRTAHILLAPEVFRAPGGIARVSRHYLQAIAENEPNDEVAIVVLNDETIDAENLKSCRAQRVKAVPCNRSKWKCFRTIWQLSRSDHSHVTCTHVNLSPVLWLARLWGRKLTYDVVVHGIEVWRPLPWPVRRSLEGATRIFSVSEFTRQELVERYPQLKTKTAVLPNALDPSFDLSGTSPKTATILHRILTVSRLSAHDWEKGIDHLIEAMAEVRRSLSDAELIIIGDGVDRPRLESLAQQSEAAKSIRFLGRVNDDRLREEFNRCQIFALPSRKEGFGLVYLEAMAAGKPCIVANAGGAPEVIDEYSGLVVPYGEVPLLSEALCAALKHPWRIAAVQARARQFSFPAFVDRWKTLSSLAV